MEELHLRPVPRAAWVSTSLPPLLLLLLWTLLLGLFGAGAVLRWGLQSLPELLLIVGAAALMYLLPGLALLRLLWRGPAHGLPERLVLAWALGVALPPLLLQLALLVGLPWQRWTTIGYLVLALLLLLGRQPLAAWATLPRMRLQRSWPALALAGLLGLALLVRLYAVRGLPTGMWGDSYQHTVMAQLLVDNQGLFSSWQPYAPLTSFTYHYGFHSNVAFFHWLTGTPVPRAVLLVGQILNAATLALAFVFTAWLTGSRWAGIWAALLTGFINLQPAFYVNWGRYTQLAGQVILPAVLIAWMLVLEQERRDWRAMLLAGILSAALILTHYVVTLFAALFLLVYGLALFVRRPGRAMLWQLAARTGIVLGFSLLLAGYWLVHVFSHRLGLFLSSFLQNKVAGTQLGAQLSSLPAAAPTYLKGPLIALAALALVLALARRDWRILLLGVWAQLLVLASVPQAVGLPGTGMITSFAVYIALYVPLLPLAGYALAVAAGALARRWPQLAYGLCGLVLLAGSAWGTAWQQSIVSPEYQLFTAADAQAMEWIKRSTPAEARFLVNAFPAYAGTSVVGSDGGWWLPLLTRRWSSLPPLTYVSELGPEPDYMQQVNARVERLRGRPLSDLTPVRIDLTRPEALQVLRELDIDYVYSGAQPRPGPEGADRIDTAILRAGSQFRLVYEAAGVEIFQFVDQP